MKIAVVISVALNIALGVALVVRHPQPRFMQVSHTDDANMFMMFDQKSGTICWAAPSRSELIPKSIPYCKDLR